MIILLLIEISLQILVFKWKVRQLIWNVYFCFFHTFSTLWNVK